MPINQDQLVPVDKETLKKYANQLLQTAEKSDEYKKQGLQYVPKTQEALQKALDEYERAKGTLGTGAYETPTPPPMDLSMGAGKPTGFNLGGKPVEELRVSDTRPSLDPELNMVRKTQYAPIGQRGITEVAKRREERGEKAALPQSERSFGIKDVPKAGAAAAEFLARTGKTVGRGLLGLGMMVSPYDYTPDWTRAADQFDEFSDLAINTYLDKSTQDPEMRRAIEKGVGLFTQVPAMAAAGLAPVSGAMGLLSGAEANLAREQAARSGQPVPPEVAAMDELGALKLGAKEYLKGALLHGAFKLEGYAPYASTRVGLQALTGYGLVKAAGGSDEEAIEEAITFGVLGATGEMKRVPLKQGFGEATDQASDTLARLKAFRSGVAPEKLTKGPGGKLEYVFGRPRRFQLDQNTGNVYIDLSRSIARMAQDAANAVRDKAMQPEVAKRLQEFSEKLTAKSNLKAIEKAGIPIVWENVKRLGGPVEYLKNPDIVADLTRQVRKKTIESLRIVDENGKLRTDAIHQFLPTWSVETKSFVDGDEYVVFSEPKGGRRIAFKKSNPEELLMRIPGADNLDVFGRTVFPGGQKDGFWKPLRREDFAATVELTGKEGIETLGHELAHVFFRYSLSPIEFQSLKQHFTNRNMFDPYLDMVNGKYLPGVARPQISRQEWWSMPWEERAASVMGYMQWAKRTEPLRRAARALQPGAKEGPPNPFDKVGLKVMEMSEKVSDMFSRFKNVVFGSTKDVSPWVEQLTTLRAVDKMMTEGTAEFSKFGVNIDEAISVAARTRGASVKEMASNARALIPSFNLSENPGVRFGVAEEQMRGPGGKLMEDVGDWVDKHVGIKAQKNQRSMGTYEDYAEAAVYQQFGGEVSWDQLLYSAAIRGLLMRQKSVLVFRGEPNYVDPSGRRTGMYEYSVSGDVKPETIWQESVRMGVPYLNIVPERAKGPGGESSYTVRVADPGFQENFQETIKSLADIMVNKGWLKDGKVHFYPGQVAFVGDAAYDPAKQRPARSYAGKSYRDIIAEYEARYPNRRPLRGHEDFRFDFVGFNPPGGRVQFTNDKGQAFRSREQDAPTKEFDASRLPPNNLTGDEYLRRWRDLPREERRRLYDNWMIDPSHPLPTPPKIEPGMFHDTAIRTKDGNVYWSDHMAAKFLHEELAFHYGISPEQVESRGEIRDGEYQPFGTSSRYFHSRYKGAYPKKEVPDWLYPPDRRGETKTIRDIKGFFGEYAKNNFSGPWPLNAKPEKAAEWFSDPKHEQWTGPAKFAWSIIQDPKTGNTVARDSMDMVRNVKTWADKVGDTATSELAEMLLGTPWASAPVDVRYGVNSKAYANYDQAAGRMQIGLNAEPHRLPFIVLHEAIHTAVGRYQSKLPLEMKNRWLDLYGNLEGAMQAWATKASAKLRELHGGNVPYEELRKVKFPEQMYGFNNFEEVMAEYANPKFREYLAQAGQDVVDSLRKMLFEVAKYPRKGLADGEMTDVLMAVPFGENGAGGWSIINTTRRGEIGTINSIMHPEIKTAEQAVEFARKSLSGTYYRTRDKGPKYTGPNPAKRRPFFESKRNITALADSTAEDLPKGGRIYSRKYFMDRAMAWSQGISPDRTPDWYGMSRVSFENLPLHRRGDILNNIDRVWYIMSDPKDNTKVATDIVDMVQNAKNWAVALNRKIKEAGMPYDQELLLLARSADFVLKHRDRASGPVFVHEKASRYAGNIAGSFGPFTGTTTLAANGPPELFPFTVVHEAIHSTLEKHHSKLPKYMKKQWESMYARLINKAWGNAARQDAKRTGRVNWLKAQHQGLLKEYGVANEREALAELTQRSWTTKLSKVGMLHDVRGMAEKIASVPLKRIEKKPVDTSRWSVVDGAQIGKPDRWYIVEQGQRPASWSTSFIQQALGMPERIMLPDHPRIQGTIGVVDKASYPHLNTPAKVLKAAVSDVQDTYLRSRKRSDMPAVTSAQKRVASIVEPRKPWRVGIAEALDSIREGTGGKLMTDIVDRWNPLLSWQRQIEKKTGSKILMKQSPYWAMIGMGGREGLIQLSYDKLREITLPIRDIEGDFTEYLVSKRLLERERRGATNPQGIDYGTAQKALDDLREQLGPEKWGRIEEAATRFWKWADTEILARLVDAHVISKKSYEKILRENKNWLPFDKSSSTEELEKQFNVDARNHGDDIMPNVDSVIQTMYGMAETARIKDPWETILHRLHVVTNFAERNKALLKIVQMRNMDPSVREYIRRIKPGQELPPNTGQFGVVINGKVVKYSAPVDIIKSLQTLAPRELSRIDELFRKHRNIFTMGTTGMYLPFTIFNIPRDFQMAMLTSRHQFNIARWMYGLMHSLPSSFGLKTNLYKEYLAAQAGGAGLTEKIGPRGGEMGFTERVASGARPEAVKQLFETKLTTNLRGLKNPPVELAKFLKSFTGTFELATRMGVFSAARKNLGPNRLFEAGMEARRSTIDFNRGGTLVKLANDFVPFLNASVQAKANMFEALFGDGDLRTGTARGPFGIKEKDARAAAWDRAMLWMVLPTLGAYFYNRTYHDEEYQKLDEDYKSKFVPIMVGTGVDEFGKETVKFVPVPKDDFLRLVTRPMERFLDWAWKKDPVKWQHVAMEFLSNLSPVDFEKEGKFNLRRAISGVVPPIAKTAGVFLYGRDPYWDREIVPEQLQKVEPYEQYRSNTPRPYVWAGKMANKVLGDSAPQLQSPLMLESAMRQSFGNVASAPTPGSMLTKIKERTVREVPTTSVRRAMEWDKKMSTGYNTARTRAERILEKGYRKVGSQWTLDPEAEKKAMNMMIAWNKKFVADLKSVEADLGNAPGSTWRSQYTIDTDEWEELKQKVQERVAGTRKLDIERRLGFTIK